MRKAPSASYNGVDLHKFADDRRLLWIGGPAAAYDRARHFLQFTAEELERVPLESGFRRLQGLPPGGVAFVFRPSHGDKRSALNAYEEILDIAAVRRWGVLGAAEFLSLIDGAHSATLSTTIGVDLASGPDTLAVFYAGQPMTPAEFVKYARAQFSRGALSYEVDQSVLHLLIDLAEIATREGDKA